MNAARIIGATIGRKLGLIPQDRWVAVLQRAEPELVRRHGRGLEELIAVIESDADVFLELAGLLSVGETYFLRHNGHFDLVVERVASRIAKLGRDERVQIWSAGCSSGEEPYSIAIAIHARLGQEALSRVEIVGTDVDARAIAKAERASFTPWSFRGAPPWLLPTYFTRSDGSLVSLSHEGVRRAVRFERMPLASRAPMFAAGSLDVVLFRNVAIYLLDEARIELQTEMRRALCEGGLLIQGPSDPPPPGEHFALKPSDTTYCCFEAASGAAKAAGSRAVHRTSRRTPVHLADTVRPSALRLGRPAALTPTPPRVPTPVPIARPVVVTDRTAARIESALGRAERGDVDGALLELQLETEANDAEERQLRGKIFLAARRLPEAIDELRSAVFLDPSSILPRFWYASALHAARRARPATAQLRELLRRLEGHEDGALVEDGETSGADLLGSVRFLLEAYE